MLQNLISNKNEIALHDMIVGIYFRLQINLSYSFSKNKAFAKPGSTVFPRVYRLDDAVTYSKYGLQQC